MTTETASLILTLLAHDDAQTARELAGAIGTTAAALRPALRQLVESGDVVTSGRAGATRYVLAVVPVEEQPPAVDLVTRALVQEALAAGHADVLHRRRVRGERPVIPATTDLLGDLERTAERLLAGATLHELSARAG